jgi:GNAT superfamily N-acetyltransferase
MQTEPGIVVGREDLLSPVAAALIGALNAELLGIYPEEGTCHFRLDPDEVHVDRGAFLVARADGTPVGCGAIRKFDPATAELKRMYVAPEMRGRGIGRRVLAALELEGRRLGVQRLVLETGERQAEALALYTGAGFARIPPFGEYVDSPLSVCMEKTL